MNKTVFVGDIHGDIDFVEFIDKEYLGWNKVFVGDYLDSFHWAPKHCVEAVKHILQMCERGDTRALLGNHELSYLFEGNRCSGWNQVTEMLVLPIRSQMFKHLEYYLWYPEHKILVTHGGITQRLWKDEELSTENVMAKLEEWKRQDIRDSKFGWVGHARFGSRPYGGPFWCDYDTEFQPVHGITQIFGHSPGRKIRQRGTNFNINQIELIPVRETLEFENDTFKIAKFQTVWEDGRQQMNFKEV